MKKGIQHVLLLSIFSLFVISCGDKGPKGFQKTESGLYYQFIEKNENTPQLKIGDILVGDMSVRLDDSVLLEKEGTFRRLFSIGENQFSAALKEGFLMMRQGDKATFAVLADSLAKYMPMPEYYIPKKNSYVYYDISLESIVTKERLDKEADEVRRRFQEAKEIESQIIEAYVTANNVKEKPAETGLYKISLKRGKGAKAEQGKILMVNYKGSFLDGKIFDTNIEKEAREGNIYEPARVYEPMEYVNGDVSFIPGWDEAVSSMCEGDKVRVIIPSAMAYGEYGRQPVIPPYTPLIFEIEVVSVK